MTLYKDAIMEGIGTDTFTKSRTPEVYLIKNT